MTTVVAAAGMTMVLNYAVHTAAALTYDRFCVAHSIWEVPYSLVSTASPVCSFLVSTIQVTQNNFATMLSTTIAATLVRFLKPS
jgi:hypothetical protein